MRAAAFVATVLVAPAAGLGLEHAGHRALHEGTPELEREAIATIAGLIIGAIGVAAGGTGIGLAVDDRVQSDKAEHKAKIRAIKDVAAALSITQAEASGTIRVAMADLTRFERGLRAAQDAGYGVTDMHAYAAAVGELKAAVGGKNSPGSLRHALHKSKEYKEEFGDTWVLRTDALELGKMYEVSIQKVRLAACVVCVRTFFG